MRKKEKEKEKDFCRAMDSVATTYLAIGVVVAVCTLLAFGFMASTKPPTFSGFGGIAEQGYNTLWGISQLFVFVGPGFSCSGLALLLLLGVPWMPSKGGVFMRTIFFILVVGVVLVGGGILGGALNMEGAKLLPETVTMPEGFWEPYVAGLLFHCLFFVIAFLIVDAGLEEAKR